jgi:S-adenosylmethionine:tRNA ribosyltransferase-isomerase
MRTADFDFTLPPDLIAQQPTAGRDESRLLILDRAQGKTRHGLFPDLLNYLQPGDVLVLNDSRVIPARLRGVNATSPGQFEILLLEENNLNDWWTMIRPGKRARIGTKIKIKVRDDANPSSENFSEIVAVVKEINDEGHRRLEFSAKRNILEDLDELGEIPLPPYIRRSPGSRFESDRERYQTVFAQPAGSVAAPTAGLHFTESLLNDIRSRGVRVCFVTLHVGLGTFAPVKAEALAAHRMHEERYCVNEETARLVNEARQAGRRVVAVGTTTVRVLESIAQQHGQLVPGAGRTRIFIHPPCDFKVVDRLLTNFHLPCSTLLMLVSAFASPKKLTGREIILAAYAEAIRHRYRFFSYGDAMLIL